MFFSKPLIVNRNFRNVVVKSLILFTFRFLLFTFKPMDYLPHDPAILVSSVNMLLRDEEFDSLEALCYSFGREPQEVKAYLNGNGFVWSERQKQFRPEGYDA